MRSRAVAALILLSILTAILAVSCRAASTEADGTVLTASEAKRWTSLFDRRGESGWLGADGIYSVSLDGNDAFGSARADTKTFFIFSDTLMGKADKHGDLHEISPMPAQSSAILNGKRPSESKIDFIWGDGGSGNLGEHLFGEHKWMLDCFVQGGTLYILGFPEEDWKPERIDMVSIPIKDGAPAFGEYTVTEDISELWRRVGDNYLYAFGIGITPNTESAGAADPDGYIYIYGYRDAMREMSRKDLIVGRIHESDFPDFSKFRYWDGEGWCDNIEDSAPLLSSVSCEMSVSYIPVGAYAGKYIAVYTQYTRSASIMYAIGETPYGPFDTPVLCYTAPEHGMASASGGGELVVYNAKAHPHLSRGDKLLISYNVNVSGEGIEQWTTDYYPRFIELDLDPEREVILGIHLGKWLILPIAIALPISALPISAYVTRKKRMDRNRSEKP